MESCISLLSSVHFQGVKTENSKEVYIHVPLLVLIFEPRRNETKLKLIILSSTDISTTRKIVLYVDWVRERYIYIYLGSKMFHE